MFFSYTWIPVAKVKKGALSGSELVGSRPGLIPKHQASLWSTYKLGSDWRFGAGVTGRTKMYPAQINTFQVEGYTTYDAMVEYQATRDLTLKLNGTNLSNKLYADNVYRGHYVPGIGRTFALTTAPDTVEYGRGAKVHQDPERVLRKVIEDLLAHGSSEAIAAREERILATVACHSVVRAGDMLDEMKARALLSSMDEEAFVPHCPHGRPVLIRFAPGEIERRFGRA